MSFERISEMFPAVDAAHLKALADVWSEELERIIKRMLDISAGEGSAVLPRAAQHEAIFELARLALHLEKSIIESKTAGSPIEAIDPQAERLALNSPAELEKIENTAKICADRIWKPLQEEWHKKYSLIVTPEQNRRKRRVSKPSGSTGVQVQHYSPVFSNRYWASGNRNEVRVYRRGVDLMIESSDVGYKTWGREDFIYSQDLEHYFHLVEGDAERPYSKLLKMIPLSEEERRRWIAYIAVQVFRTPSSIARLLPRLPQALAMKGIKYPSDIGSLRRAYETLFRNDNVFAFFYRKLVSLRWAIWHAPSDVEFIRSDDPVLIEGSTSKRSWRLVYPMTPLRCFVAGPDKANEQPVVIPATKILEESESWSLNERMARAARRTVIARIRADDSPLRSLLESALSFDRIGRDFLSETFREYWGRMVCA